MITLHPFSANAAKDQAHLRLIETTDLHVHVLPYDYYTDRPDDSIGLARIASLVSNLRSDASNSLLFDDGDFLQGSPMGDYIAYERGMRDGDLHPIIAAMNAMEFDAATIGNHEFNYGLSFLLKSLAGAEFPVVSANVVREKRNEPTNDTPLVPPYKILNRVVIDGIGQHHNIKIGVIGFVPPLVMNWDRRHLEGNVQTRDIIEAAQAYIPEMKERGAELIIALNHSGIAEANTFEGQENTSVALAAIDGIDAILSGHQHLLFPGPAFDGLIGVDTQKGTLMGKPAVMGGFWGSHLGLIDLMIEQSGGQWRVIAHESKTCPMPPHREKAEKFSDCSRPVLSAVQKAHAETLQYVRRGVGKTSTPLHSYFSLIAPDASEQLVSSAQLWYLKMMLEDSEYDQLPLLSASAPFKAGGRGGPTNYTDVPAGDLAIRNIADLYLYPNTFRALCITGLELTEWLERSAGQFNQIHPGQQNQILLNPDFPSYNFDVVSGVTYTIDLSQPSRLDSRGVLVNPKARRITQLQYQGVDVRTDQKFIIATNSYRASGGGDFPGAFTDNTVFEGPDTNRDVIARYILEHDVIHPNTDRNWSFAPMPDTTVLFDTSPAAHTFLGDIDHMNITPDGNTEDGFARFKIKL
ncbi:bifunctional 2',3'-cyclic-nucleotide 2'-phosphodiesterase/3'-nucleotidase [Cochlodiniinecator piscidefendens]|uniref:bifunctional 2',3'-cyclic-nucleotide 2'-phosphodiesterase/3'-nucleotidase n=1 Tax=Cochlodiniinecator piscidefendens TaxID=2715756 RepID=UPI00140B7335|nr:bifunctional 2',3'-cyclic-nucleotide 2'-phosphodiesterase/3'-nucleotidase [Cochlodiniinecator piscidefendens]